MNGLLALTCLGLPVLGTDTLNASFRQVHPPPSAPAAVARSPGQARAIVLIHGFRIEFNNAAAALGDLHAWQTAGSVAVKTFAQEGDVFAFAYAQDNTLEEIANGVLLKPKIAQLRGLGYADIVLIGHSAGGVVARHFVEDHPDAGVTKVIQVCAPNAGSPWAALKAAVCIRQQAFVASLSEDARRQSLRMRAKKTVPSGVEFVCVVGTGRVRGDGILSCGSQWSADLREQHIPAYRLHTHHCGIMNHVESLEAIRQLIRAPQRRWTDAQIRLAACQILAE